MRKDEILDRLARRGNVAQFVGFKPTAANPLATYSRITGRAPNEASDDHRDAVAALLSASPDHSVNVRSYSPDDPRSREFVYGLKDVRSAVEAVERLSNQGLHTIVNETVDIHDGGVSGVIQGGTIEFAPDDTPRCVEKTGTVAIETKTGLDILETVYGFRPELIPVTGERTEFSIHPRPRGWRRSHTLLWEQEEGVEEPETPTPSWPNRFSRVIGDKAFGLMVAHLTGLPVPRTLVIGRRLRPFVFGAATGSNEVWTRTCPREAQPGLYTTVKGWTDPFTLLSREDPDGVIASVLSQDAVPAMYSGAAITSATGELVVEGKRGEGDRLMLGVDLPEPLPAAVYDRVVVANTMLLRRLGAVRFEWVDDGAQLWVVQLHVGATSTVGRVVVPGEAAQWQDFEAGRGLAALREFLTALPEGNGILVRGGAGVTSHVADVLRKAGVPARLSD